MAHPLDERLAAAASFVRRGAVVADIGTDHAYLPIRLLEDGIASFAVVSDIREGPLARARKNAAAAGVSDRMRFVLTDGLSGLEPEREGVSDVLVCGMGGELIARIVSESDYVKRPGVRLILCPMSSPEELRGTLAKDGFAVLDERLAEAAGKRYAVFLAQYDGQRRSFTPAELLLGRANIEKKEPLFAAFAGDWLERCETRIAGRRLGGLDTEEDEALRDEILSILEKSGGGGTKNQKSSVSEEENE